MFIEPAPHKLNLPQLHRSGTRHLRTSAIRILNPHESLPHPQLHRSAMFIEPAPHKFKSSPAPSERHKSARAPHDLSLPADLLFKRDPLGGGYLRTACDYVHLNPVRAQLLQPEERLLASPRHALAHGREPGRTSLRGYHHMKQPPGGESGQPQLGI